MCAKKRKKELSGEELIKKGRETGDEAMIKRGEDLLAQGK